MSASSYLTMLTKFPFGNILTTFSSDYTQIMLFIVFMFLMSRGTEITLCAKITENVFIYSILIKI